MNRSLLGIYQKKQQDPLANADSAAAAAATAAGQPENTSTDAADSADAAGAANGGTEDDGRSAARPLKRKQKSSSSTGNAATPRSETKRTKVAVDYKWPTPTARLSDLGGMDSIAEDVLQLVAMPLKHPEIYRHLGIDPPRGILLHGPPGCGKTMLAHAIAGEAGVPFISIAAPVVVSGMSGESEKKIREVFDEAKELAPCILFIDEIDAITPKRETAQREMERRIVAQLLTCMDDVSPAKTDYKPVIIIGATNRPDSLDAALRRAGRFDREISIGRLQFGELARLTPGYVGADLNALTAEAGMIAVKRIFESVEFPAKTPLAVLDTRAADNEDSDMAVDDEPADAGASSAVATVAHGIEKLLTATPSQASIGDFLSARPDQLTTEELEPLCIVFDDFVEALKKVQPSSKREGFATVPGVSWEDIGALGSVRDELRMAVVEPIRHPEFFVRVGITSPMGVLLYGPPGCGKTLLAKAVANESHCNFISVKGPELLNKYVGESERAVRMVFQRAQASSPCVIFFDELDALCPSRSNEAESQSSSRLVNTLLTEMDGMSGRRQVYVIAATNRPDMIDPAMLRPGRLDKTLYVDLPNAAERRDILVTMTRKTPLSASVDLDAVARHEKADGFSGADLASLVREAAVSALREAFYVSGAAGSVADATAAAAAASGGAAETQPQIFVTPSVNRKDRRKYELLKVKFGSAATGPADSAPAASDAAPLDA
ncbi:P-loop containing nucleoside triphosphate hydrolase protein [Entophlyctis helioformis]|nr:P-loop containing nucleoside triphosphate hydrolase protein [Entophlyctis helioformis]